MSVPESKREKMDADDLSAVDEAILDQLHDGRATKGALVEWTGYSQNSIYNHLKTLQAADIVTCVHEPTRLFELVEDPREE